MKKDSLGRILHRPPAIRVKAALSALEEAAGGRESLVAALLHSPETPEQRFVIGHLADPRNDRKSLAKVCAEGGITVGQLLDLLRQGKMARGLLAAIDRISKYLPEVAEDVMARSVPHDLPCPSCKGKGQIWEKRRKKQKAGPRALIPCEACAGSGLTRVLPDLERQKVALQIGGLLKPQGGTTVNVTQQQAQANFAFTPDARRDFRAATDRLLFSGQGEQGEVVEAEEAEVVSPQGSSG